MIFAVAPALAPVIGGWLLTWTSWRGIFWFLAAYAVLATAVTWFLLPESHPVAARTAFRPGALVASLASASRDPAVLRVCLAIAAGFAAMFLYVASAPAIVAGLLHLGPQDYWVQFLPMVSAMVVGSWVVGRLSGRVSTRGLIALGLVVLTLGALVQLVLTAVVHVSTLPGVLVGMALASFGVSVVFPVATVALMDLRPTQRGTVSSLQSALANAGNAAVSGALSPLVSGSFVGLALGSAALVVVAGTLWGLHFRFSGPAGSPSG